MSILDKLEAFGKAIEDRLRLRHLLRAQDDDDRAAISNIRTVAKKTSAVIEEVYADGHLSMQDIIVLAAAGESILAAVEQLKIARANTPDAPK